MQKFGTDFTSMTLKIYVVLKIRSHEHLTLKATEVNNANVEVIIILQCYNYMLSMYVPMSNINCLCNLNVTASTLDLTISTKIAGTHNCSIIMYIKYNVTHKITWSFCKETDKIFNIIMFIVYIVVTYI